MGGFAVNDQNAPRANASSSSPAPNGGRQDTASAGASHGSKDQGFLFGVYHHPNVTAAAKTIRMDPEEFAVSNDPEIEKFVHHVKYAPTRRRRLPVFEEITGKENGFSKQ
ncbi:hypothetical protein H6P81_011198 [Aristolochia fimbriata]|uniref:Uncharacterized protein n=1 Tax=Aristolochia fimbriata TaxID=158543 RepID=A0AAV7EVB5_ARIFI|nr:hypothetical protein H6P81_011198 [Aristolochia fimbriata]